jgi:hypothetical protein
MNKNRFASRIIAGLLVPAVLSLTTAIAGDAVPWNDLPKKIGRGKMRTDSREDRQYRVVTKDGLIHVGYKLLFSPKDVRLADSGASISREDVVEIRIHRDALLADALGAPAAVLLPSGGGAGGWDFGNPWQLLLLPVGLGVVVATAPVVLPIQGFKRLLPDRVIRVAP